MNYSNIYEALVRKAITRRTIQDGYFEIHHIIPRSLDGSDDDTNLVELTYREHFLAHWLLVKMFVGIPKRKMTFAFYAMSMQVGGRKISSWQFELIKRHCREQRLATKKQRDVFIQNQKLENIKKIIDRARNGGVTDWLKLDSLVKQANKVKIINGRRCYRGGSVKSLLVESGVAERSDKNKQVVMKPDFLQKKSDRTHVDRLKKWKESRGQ